MGKTSLTLLAGTALLAAGLLAGPVAAAGRVEVGVSFALAEPSYREELTDAEIAELESRAGALLVRVLKEAVGFLEYRPGGDHVYRLEVRLDDRLPGGEVAAPEVGFHFRLLGPQVPESAATYRLFRPRTAWGEPIGTVEPLLGEMERALTGTAADYPSLVREVLSHVKVSEACDLRPGAPGWILPFTPEEICLDRGSVVLIRHELVSGGISQGIDLRARYTGEIAESDPALRLLFCVPHKDEDAQQAAPLWAVPDSAVTLTGVYVVEYERRDAGCAPAIEPPSDVDFGGGS
jgi:hypothetical protein